MRSVPMQRPEQLAGRAELNDEEFAQRAASQAKAKQQEANRSTATAFGFDVGFRAFRQTSIVVEPADGRIPPLTPEAQQRTARVNAQRSDGACLVGGSELLRPLHHTRRARLRPFPSSTATATQILQTPGYVAITYEMVHDTRIIPLDGRPHVCHRRSACTWATRAAVGKATRWSSRPRISSATRLASAPNGGGTPATDALRLVERFTRVADDRIDYEVTIDDPQDLHAALEDPAAVHHATRLSGAAVRVSRRKSGDRQHPQRARAPRTGRRPMP